MLFLLCTVWARFMSSAPPMVEGMTTVVYTASDGTSATLQGNTIVVTMPDKTLVTYTQSPNSKRIYYASNGSTAVVSTKNGTAIITLTDAVSGNNVVLYAPTSATTTTSTADGTVVFYAPDGSTARVVSTGSENTLVVTTTTGQTTTYYIDTGNTDPSVTVYYGENGGSAKVLSANGTKTVEIIRPDGSKVVYTTKGSANQIDYFDDPDTHLYAGPTAVAIQGDEGNTAVITNTSTTAGITRSQIPPGDEDLYILKSQTLVPICPRCEPVVIEKTECQPCPAPQRCPEPQFECTKTFTSRAFNPATAPVPVLADFRTFGM